MKGLRLLLSNPEILRIACGVGILHALLTAIFILVPSLLLNLTGATLASHAAYYAIGVTLVFLTVFPMLRWVEKRHWQQRALICSVIFLGLSQILMGAMTQHVLVFFFALIVFFMAFNLLEASLPAAMSRVAPLEYRGAAMGVYSTFQFAGTFIGGVLGGLLLQYVSTSIYFFVQAFIILLWLMLIISKK
jgi:MFS family permease